MGSGTSLVMIVIGYAAIWIIGNRLLSTSGGKGEKLCYSTLILWCISISMAHWLHWVLPTTATAKVVIYSPVGHWLELFLLG